MTGRPSQDVSVSVRLVHLPIGLYRKPRHVGLKPCYSGPSTFRVSGNKVVRSNGRAAARLLHVGRLTWQASRERVEMVAGLHLAAGLEAKHIISLGSTTS